MKEDLRPDDDESNGQENGIWAYMQWLIGTVGYPALWSAIQESLTAKTRTWTKLQVFCTLRRPIHALVRRPPRTRIRDS